MVSAFTPSAADHPVMIRARPYHNCPELPGASNVLSAEQQDLLREIASVQNYGGRNEIILSEGSEANFVYLVISGLVRICRTGESGRCQVLAIKMRGDIFGFPEHGIYVNTARTMGPVTVYRMHWSNLNELMSREPSLQASLFAHVLFELREAQKHIVLLGQQSILQRLGSFFLDLMRHEEFYNAKRKTLSLPLSRFDLAELLGTRAETIVRALARMEARGLIRRISSRQMTIMDSDQLLALLSEARRCD